MDKPKKGDAVVLEQKHSSHDTKMRKTMWSTYQIAMATKVEKNGLVRGVILPGGEKPAVLGSYRVLTVSDPQHQEGARRLYKRITPDTNSWPDSDSIKKAIIEAFNWDRVL
jgi:hypothetical protein